MRNSDILVIIVSYNSMQWAERCYNSLRASTVHCDIIMIDNGSTDESVLFVRSHYPEVEIIEAKENLGFGKANNIGLRKVLSEGYKYAYLLNQDAWVLPNTIENLISVSVAHPDYGVISPMQMTADLCHLDSRFRDLSLHGYLRTPSSFVEDVIFGRISDIYETNFVMAAHWLITADCLYTVGGFSPTFPHYGEDCNYLHRVLHFNKKIGFAPAAKAVHDRNNNTWSYKKEIYVNDYIGALVAISNPLHKESLLKMLKINLKKALRQKNKDNIIIAFLLLKRYYNVNRNYYSSLKQRAFLA